MPLQPSEKAHKLMYWQLGFGILVSLAWCFHSVDAMWSAALGALAAIIPNLLFARHLFKNWRSKKPSQILLSLYFGELGKLFLVAILAILFIKLLDARILAMMTGLVAAYVGFWVRAPAVMAANE